MQNSDICSRYLVIPTGYRYDIDINIREIIIEAPHWPIKMPGHTQPVIRHFPEENKLKKTRNLNIQPYSVERNRKNYD